MPEEPLEKIEITEMETASIISNHGISHFFRPILEKVSALDSPTKCIRINKQLSPVLIARLRHAAKAHFGFNVTVRTRPGEVFIWKGSPVLK